LNKRWNHSLSVRGAGGESRQPDLPVWCGREDSCKDGRYWIVSVHPVLPTPFPYSA